MFRTHEEKVKDIADAAMLVANAPVNELTDAQRQLEDALATVTPHNEDQEMEPNRLISAAMLRRAHAMLMDASPLWDGSNWTRYNKEV